ncbi:phosphomethylpyrimidine synthase ThiC [Methanohalophilus euhalobius]|uniref:Radical SAM ThiC family protein n=1 Tax=Methanohalophilus euhalobius TaxID=51203 RepID=A0A314ZY66_9EURY|nr:phosphomethylpyrimidine synthase ThiC [Methanohalophilus euhalobius]PQV43017.1 radical SAM ThiC family protein [Methanohalophilus euhalobius]
MLTQIDHARNGELTAEMQQVAVQEKMDPDTVLSRVKEGSLVIMTRHGNPPVAIGEGAATKIAAHIGDSMKYGLAEKDRLLAKRRTSFDWEGQMELAFDPDRPRDFCPMEGPCSMCGNTVPYR